jgi:hypothetical protein
VNGNPEPTAQRITELKRILDAVLDEIVGLPGFTSAGIGLTSVAKDRPGMSPETVQPEDLVVAVSFSDAGLLERARGEINRVLPGVPVDLYVRGPVHPV